MTRAEAYLHLLSACQQSAGGLHNAPEETVAIRAMALFSAFERRFIFDAQDFTYHIATSFERSLRSIQ